jgi:hypothetical protein
MDAFVLDFDQVIQLSDELIEEFGVFLGLDADAEFVHLLSFVRGHSFGPPMNTG